jgi:hypothetical protein
MSKQFLDGANIGTFFQHVRCEAMAQCVWAYFAKPRFSAEFSHHKPQGTSIQGPIGFVANQVKFLVLDVSTEPLSGLRERNS